MQWMYQKERETEIVTIVVAWEWRKEMIRKSHHAKILVVPARCSALEAGKAKMHLKNQAQLAGYYDNTSSPSPMFADK